MGDSALETALHPGDFAVIAVYFASILFLGLWVRVTFVYRSSQKFKHQIFFQKILMSSNKNGSKCVNNVVK